jgi:hypothetical protein
VHIQHTPLDADTAALATVLADQLRSRDYRLLSDVLRGGQRVKDRSVAVVHVDGAADRRVIVHCGGRPPARASASRSTPIARIGR